MNPIEMAPRPRLRGEPVHLLVDSKGVKPHRLAPPADRRMI
jgi:hypothetical protein